MSDPTAQPIPKCERHPIRYYAHTAEDSEGNRLPERSGKWPYPVRACEYGKNDLIGVILLRAIA